jgi:hypothetical protein
MVSADEHHEAHKRHQQKGRHGNILRGSGALERPSGEKIASPGHCLQFLTIGTEAVFLPRRDRVGDIVPLARTSDNALIAASARGPRDIERKTVEPKLDFG